MIKVGNGLEVCGGQGWGEWVATALQLLKRMAHAILYLYLIVSLIDIVEYKGDGGGGRQAHHARMKYLIV